MSNRQRKFMRLGLDGKAIVNKKVQDGAFRTSPRSLLDPDSTYSRILTILYQMGGMHTSKEIARLYDQRYKPKKVVNRIAPRLSELFTLGLVSRIQKYGNANVVLYGLVPDVNLKDTEQLYQRAVERQSQIQALIDGKAKFCALPRSPAAIIFEV